MMFSGEKNHTESDQFSSIPVCVRLLFVSFSHFMIHLHIDRVLLSRSDPVAEGNVVQRYVPWAALRGFHC
jgi:hypothetical protein